MITAFKTKALDFATAAHQGQIRKGSGLPYITHPLAVAKIAVDRATVSSASWTWNVGDVELSEIDLLYVISLLHDTVEDSPDVTLEIIKDIFGETIARSVDALTKREGESYLDAVLRAKGDYFASQVKWADNEHNASDLKTGSLLDKYRMSQYILTKHERTRTTRIRIHHGCCNI